MKLTKTRNGPRTVDMLRREMDHLKKVFSSF